MRKSLRDGKMRRRFITAAGLGCALSFTLPARSADVTWQGDVSLNWAISGNWDAAALPTLDDDALIDNGQTVGISSNVGDANNVLLGGDSTVAISASGSLNVITDFSVGSEADSPGALTQSAGSLEVGRFLKVGDFATGAYAISGGTTTIGAEGGVAALLAGASVDSTITVTGGELRQADVDADNLESINYLGIGPGGAATVELSAGTISMFATTILGEGGATAVVNQTGGVFETRDRSVRLGGLGDEANIGQATYNISGGTLATGNMLAVGNSDFSTAEMNISGLADVQVGGAMSIGVGSSLGGAEGVLNISGGTLSVGVLYDAEAEIDNRLIIGVTNDGSGIMNMSGDAVVDVAGAMSVAGLFAGPARGELNVTGGVLLVGQNRDPEFDRNTIGEDDFMVGAADGAVGIVNFGGAAIMEIGGAMLVGGTSFHAAEGVMNQTGGDILIGTLADPATLPGVFADNDFSVGAGTGAVGRYNMSGGTLTAPGFASIGSDGSVDAEVVISGVDTLMQVSGEGSAFQVGGQTGTALDDPNYGQPTFGRLTQNGGTVFVDGQLQVGSGPTAHGIYDLNEGALDVLGATLLSGAPPFEFEPGVISTAESEFNQSGGESVFRRAIQVGDFGKGTINLTGGTMSSAVPLGGVALFVGDNDLSAGSQVNFSGGEFTTEAAVLVGFFSAKDVEMNVSGDAVVTVGHIFRLGADVNIDSDSFNEGTVNQTGGVMNLNGQLQIATGLPDGNPLERANGYYNISGGQLNLPDTAFLGVDGTGAFRQSGGVVQSGNSLVIAETPEAEFAYELSGGTLNINRQAIFFGDGNASFEFTGGRLEGAEFIAFSLTQTGGVLSTGDFPDAEEPEMFAEIDGDYSIADAGALEIKIGGLEQLVEYDFFQVNGTASLGGALNVVLTNDFLPQIGDEFEVLFSAGGNLIGEFDSLVFPNLPNIDGELEYTAQSVFLRIVEPGVDVEGDTNDDGRVDIVDLNNVRNNFGGNGLGDTNGDGVVTIADLNAVRNNFGFGTSPPADSFLPSAGGARVNSPFNNGPNFVRAELNLDGARAEALLHGGIGGANPTAVPEPTTWSLALLATLGGVLAFRRRRG